LSDFGTIDEREGSKDEDSAGATDEDEAGKSELGDSEAGDDGAESEKGEASEEPTIEEANSVETGGDSENDESEDDDGTRNVGNDGATGTTSETMSEAETEHTSDRDVEASDEPTGEREAAEEPETSSGSEGDASLIDVRDTVLDNAADLIGRRLDGISGIERTEEGWSAIVNVIERRSVPDTQDVLGRYEMTLDSSGEIVGYHRLNRYRRGDTTQEEWQ
jgi:hypothetical protein